MTSRMGRDRRYGLMEPVIREITSRGKNMGRDCLNGLMGQYMRDSLIRTIFMVRVSINGRMVVSMWETGGTIKWKAKEY